MKTLRRTGRYLKDSIFLLVYYYLADILFKIKYVLSKEGHNGGVTSPGVNFAGYLGSKKGLGEAARSIVRILQETDMPIALNNIEHRWMKSTEHQYANLYGNENPYRINILHANAEMVPHAANQLGTSWFAGRYNIGYWIWELEKFPKKWNRIFGYFDEIWTASEFCRSSISAHSPVPVVTIPHSIRVIADAAFDRRYFGLDEKKFIFHFAFDAGSGYERKNPLATIAAFRRAFSGRSFHDVTLLLKCAIWKESEMAYKELLRATEDLPIIIITSLLKREEVYGLISVCDCYVSLHRSEGFGLTLAEAMDFGKPVIATGYSGNLEFMNQENSLLVNYEMKTLDRDYGPYKKGNKWAEPDIEHAADLMRRVFEDREYAKSIGRKGSEHIKKYFSPEALKPCIEGRLNEIGRVSHGRQLQDR